MSDMQTSPDDELANIICWEACCGGMKGGLESIELIKAWADKRNQGQIPDKEDLKFILRDVLEHRSLPKAERIPDEQYLEKVAVRLQELSAGSQTQTVGDISVPHKASLAPAGDDLLRTSAKNPNPSDDVDDELRNILSDEDWRYTYKPARLLAWSDRRTAAVLERLKVNAAPWTDYEAVAISEIDTELAALNPPKEKNDAK